MSVVENLPPSVEKALASLGKSTDTVQFATSTDITRDGNFGERWLVAIDDRALVLDPTPAQASVLVDVPYSEITEVNAEPLVGGGVLTVLHDGQRITLLHYSNTLSGKFNRAARVLQAIANNEETPEEEDEDQEALCPSCGRSLPKYTKVCPHCLDKGKVMRRLLAYLKPYKGKSALVTLLLLASTAVSLVPPMLSRALWDISLMPKAKVPIPAASRVHSLLLIVAGMLGVRLLTYGTGVWRQQVAAWLGGRVTLDVRREVYSALQRLSLAYFDKRQTGAVMSRVTQDTGALQVFLVSSAQYFLVFILQIIGICIMLFVTNWKLALIALSPAPIVSGITFLFTKRLRFVYTRYWSSWSRLTAMLSDSLAGIRVVRAFAQEGREMKRFSDSSTGLFESEYSATRLVNVLVPTLSLLIEFGLYPVWLVGGIMVINNSMTMGTLLMFTGYLAMFYGPLQWLTNLADSLPRSLTAAERVFEVLDTEPEVADVENSIPLPDLKGHIEIKDITFGYDKNKPILKNVSLEVQPGEMIGLVGKTGAGKSTFINLVCRFYDPQAGEILIDGQPLRQVRLRDLRSQIGVVLQEAFLFSGTISENIAYGKPTAHAEEIMRAAKAANAHDFIMRFPDGYDAQVGERGGRLSGGERQRISIARAILHNPRILIFDEATSAVDTETERQIQEAIERLVENRTTFAIAHRLSTLRNADRIMVIEDGGIAELGTHDELMEKRGSYWKLVQIQTEMAASRVGEPAEESDRMTA
ncbi:MAG: ABC transporter ATP-binding protein [Armatimonadetes bacterium]|nr:ABC transporter ATP-binding protein [Armatimonadota bacterium]